MQTSHSTGTLLAKIVSDGAKICSFQRYVRRILRFPNNGLIAENQTLEALNSAMRKARTSCQRPPEGVSASNQINFPFSFAADCSDVTIFKSCQGNIFCFLATRLQEANAVAEAVDRT